MCDSFLMVHISFPSVTLYKGRVAVLGRSSGPPVSNDGAAGESTPGKRPHWYEIYLFAVNSWAYDYAF